MTGARELRLRLDGVAVRTDPVGTCADLVARLRSTRAEVVVCDAAGLGAADIALVGALARLGLAARRAGAELVLDGAADDLRALLVL